MYHMNKTITIYTISFLFYFEYSNFMQKFIFFSRKGRSLVDIYIFFVLIFPLEFICTSNIKVVYTLK